jgi:SAM-dependent methyltransferase
MDGMLGKVQAARQEVLDVGSLDVNGTYRPLVERRGWKYTGLDVRPGPNVDIVAEDPFRYPFEAGTFDIVMSGSTMEHVTAIWRWAPELARVLRPGGLLALHTHWSFPEHRYPIDCWRILPDGMAYLFDCCGNLERYEIRMANEHDLVGTAWKRWAITPPPTPPHRKTAMERGVLEMRG